MRAAIYARVSTERQERQQSIDSQLAGLRRWAEAEGHALAEAHVFRDDGYSGSRLDRPGLDGLRDAVSDAAVEIVAVLSPDRLARRYAYQVLLLEEFRRAGVEVAFLHRPISEDPSDQLLLQIQGAVAEYERAVLAERFRRGKLQKARDGHLLSAKAPYGYRYVPRRDAVPGHLVIDDAEAEDGARAVRVGGGRAPVRAPGCAAAERGAVGDPRRPNALGVLDGAPHPVRSRVHRHRLRQPLRVRRAEEAAHPLAALRGEDLPTPPHSPQRLG